MSLFGDDTALTGGQDRLGAPFVSDEQRAAQLKADSRRTRGWVILIAALVLGLVMSFLPTGYVIEQPGPVFDTLGVQSHDDGDVPLISIDGEPTFPTGGTLSWPGLVAAPRISVDADCIYDAQANSCQGR